jgi:hypothetical protein
MDLMVRGEGVFRIGTQLNPEFLLHADYPPATEGRDRSSR